MVDRKQDGISHIKSEELCARCVYMRNCRKEFPEPCLLCAMFCYSDTGFCKCLSIKKNTPCPYFKEVKDND